MVTVSGQALQKCFILFSLHVHKMFELAKTGFKIIAVVLNWIWNKWKYSHNFVAEELFNRYVIHFGVKIYNFMKNFLSKRWPTLQFYKSIKSDGTAKFNQHELNIWYFIYKILHVGEIEYAISESRSRKINSFSMFQCQKVTTPFKRHMKYRANLVPWNSLIYIVQFA